MKKLWHEAITLVLMGVLLAGCGPLGRLVQGTPTPTPALATYVPAVQSVQVQAVTYADRGCAPATEPVDARILLDVRGLAAGDYTVTVNGVSAAFRLKSGG